MVLSSGTGARPRSMPTKRRSTGDSYSASSAPGSLRLNHCCRKCTRSMMLRPTGGRPLGPGCQGLVRHPSAQYNLKCTKPVLFNRVRYDGSETSDTGALTDDPTWQIDGLRVGPDDLHCAEPRSVAAHSARLGCRVA